MENKQVEESREILESIKKAIEVYNGLNPEEKVVLQDEKKDVSNIFVCVYGTDAHNNHVGLFREIKYSSDTQYGTMYTSGSVFKGLDSNYIGIKQSHIADMFSDSAVAGMKVTLGDKSYVSNCHLRNIMSFDDMRLIMYREGLIAPYEIGKASSKEMIDVLAYASSYHKLDQNVPSQRAK